LGKSQTVSNLVHPLNAQFSMVVTELGIVTEVSPPKFLHRNIGIIVTLFPKFIVEILVSPSKTTWLLLPAWIQLSALKLTVVNPVQFLNADSPI